MDFESTSSASWDTEGYAGFQRVFLPFALLILTPSKAILHCILREQQPFIRKIKGILGKWQSYPTTELAPPRIYSLV